MNGQPISTWLQEAVLYHVYLRSFADANGDGIGDLPGLLGRLDYLRGGPASLGVDAVWLSPLYPTPDADFGYDVADYLGVDPRFGTPEDIDRLVAEGSRRGLGVVIDLILNHTSTEHPWFVAARSSRADPRRAYYLWAPPRDDGGPPNNWLSAFRQVGSAWTLDEPTGECYLHTFTPEQADLNWRNPAVRAAMWNVVRFWLDRGVAGFRIDVAHRLMKDPDFADNPAVLAREHRHVCHPDARQVNVDHPDVHDVLRELRAVVNGYGDIAMLGEVPIHDASRLVRYFGDGDELHLVFNFALWDAPWDARAFGVAVRELETNLPSGGWPCYALANHDIGRVASRYDSDGRGQMRARVAAMFLLTVRGTPCLYYGDEIGMTSVPIVPPWEPLDVDGRDPFRTPMQWSGPDGAFTTGRPWLPLAANAGERNVAAQLCDRRSILCLYRRLIQFRASSAALRRGTMDLIDAGHNVLAYWRSHGPEQLLIALNFASEPEEVRVDPDDHGPAIVLSTRPDRALDERLGTRLRLAADEGVVVRFGGRCSV